jgi:hypothetical protein
MYGTLCWPLFCVGVAVGSYCEGEMYAEGV